MNEAVIKQALMNGQLQTMQQGAILADTASKIMSQLVPICYVEAVNNAKAARLNEIRQELMDGTYDEQQLAQATMERFSKEPQNLKLNMNLDFLAQLSVSASKVLLKHLSQ